MRCPMISAHGKPYSPAGKRFGKEEVDAKLAKILTPEQMTQLKQMRGRGPGGRGGPGGQGGGRGGNGGPPPGGAGQHPLREGRPVMSVEAVGWYVSIVLWLFFTGIGIPPCPEEAGILYAAGVTALHPEMRWWISWPLTSAGILCADLTLYAIGR